MKQDVALKHVFDEMHIVLAGVNVDEPWRNEMQSQLREMTSAARQFMDEKYKEQYLLKGGAELGKDHPEINRYTRRPKRISGFIDTMHKLEYELSIRAEYFFLRLQDAPLSADERKEAISSFKLILEALDDRGIYLNQAKTFAASSTLPQEYDDKKPRPDILPINRVSEFFREGPHNRDTEAIKGQHYKKALLFQRIKVEQSDEKKR